MGGFRVEGMGILSNEVYWKLKLFLKIPYDSITVPQNPILEGRGLLKTWKGLGFLGVPEEMVG